MMVRLMQSRQKKDFKRITTIGLILLLLITALPMDVQAASGKAKSKKKYTVTIKNADSDTVIKKGSKLKLKCTAVSKNGKRAKIHYKSSNTKVITITRKGVIKGKKKGKSKITAYVKVKGKIRGRKTITVRVGKPVSSISLSGYNYLRAGKTSEIKAQVSSNKATNKKLKWESSNSSVVSVDSKGVVTGKGDGEAIITATAADGSGVASSIPVYSHKYTKNDTRWIAHRGLHDTETENTATAFKAAGKAGFWGCECDLYETKHDEDGNFKIVIDHDGNFRRLFGVDKKPNELTAEEISSDPRLAKVCFFDEYIRICKTKGFEMVPIVEIKALSSEGIEKMADMIYDAGLMDKAQFISFDSKLLEMTKKYVNEQYKVDPYIGYLLGGEGTSAGIEQAKSLGFSGVNISYGSLTEEISQRCTQYGLKICTWTYTDSAVSNHWLYLHLKSGKYRVDMATTDGKFFD